MRVVHPVVFSCTTGKMALTSAETRKKMEGTCLGRITGFWFWDVYWHPSGNYRMAVGYINLEFRGEA